MAKTRICLAIGKADVEEWIIQQAQKRRLDVEFTAPAPYLDLVLERVSTTMPHILVIAKDLKKGQNSPSFDAVIRKIRTSFKSCRIILLAGDKKPGDDFLKRMVSRGVYDIILGATVDLNEIFNCIQTPRDYAYAETLQGLEPEAVDDSSSIDIVAPIVEEEKRGVFRKPLPAPTPVSEPVYSTEPSMTEPEQEEEVVSDSSPANGTSVLTSPIPQISMPAPVSAPAPEKRAPRGIIFEKVSEFEKEPLPEPEPKPPVHYGNVNQSSYPVNNNRVLTAGDKMEIGGPKPLSTGYMPRITVFLGARQGVGTTTTIINTAYQLAMSGKRVAVIDAVWTEKCIFDRLGFRHESTGFNNRGGNLPSGFAGSHYKTFSDKTGKIIGAIQFLELQTGNFPADNGVIPTISRLSGYDNVLIDMSISIINETLVGLMGLADRVVAVTLQDGYELMCLRNYLNVYQTKVQVYSKMILCLNRANNKLSPSVSDTAKYIIANDIIVIPPDNTGFIRANAEKRNYIGKKKVINAYNFLISRL